MARVFGTGEDGETKLNVSYLQMGKLKLEIYHSKGGHYVTIYDIDHGYEQIAHMNASAFKTMIDIFRLAAERNKENSEKEK